MNSDMSVEVKGLRLPHKTKVFLKLKAQDYGGNNLKYRVEDSRTIFWEEGMNCEQNGHNPGKREFSRFQFDEVFDTDSDEKIVTDAITQPSVENLLNGYNVSIMSYGQSTIGKSTLLLGNQYFDGMFSTICTELFRKIEEMTKKGSDFTISTSFMEVFAENIYDLLIDSKSAKSLKLSTSSGPSSPVIVKNLKSVYVATSDELMYYMSLARNNSKEDHRQRSSVIVIIHVKQKNEEEGILKESSLHLIDLAGSDKLDKSSKSSYSSEVIRKINLSMYSLDNVARSLAAVRRTTKSSGLALQTLKNVPYQDSQLTRLLRETMGGNSKTTVVLTCSAAEKDREESLSTLDFGANMTMVENSVCQNVSGINAKSVLDLCVKNMSIKESNYISRIRILERELVNMNSKIRTHTKSETADREILRKENSTLKLQIDSLTQLLKNNDFRKGNASENMKEQSDIMATIMEKCEKIMDLQLRLDNETAKQRALSQEMSFKSSKQEALEAMNLRLLEQLQANEEELKTMLVTNSVMKDSIEKWSMLANTRLDNIKMMERLMKENALFKQYAQGKRRSSGSSSGSTMVQLDEDNNMEKGSWFFNNSSSGLWASRKAPSTNNGITAALQESLKIRPAKTGLNLRVVRPAEETENNV